MNSYSSVAALVDLICALVLSSDYAAAQSCRDKCQSAYTYRIGSCEREKASVYKCHHRLADPFANGGPCGPGQLDFNYDRCISGTAHQQKQCFHRCG